VKRKVIKYRRNKLFKERVFSQTGTFFKNTKYDKYKYNKLNDSISLTHRNIDTCAAEKLAITEITIIN